MKTAEDWLRDPGLFATSAMALLMDRWGSEFIEWEPPTVEMELRADFGIEPSAGLQDRIQAASALLTSNLFFLSLESFAVICQALNLGTTATDMFIPPDLDDVLWGVSEAYVLLGDTAREEKFSHNIALYVGKLLDDAGIRKPPSILSFAEYPTEQASGSIEAAETDEVFFKSFWDAQEQERDALETENGIRLMLLFRQLASLPLKSGDASSIRERLIESGVAVGGSSR
jgi:hypothetical protein